MKLVNFVRRGILLVNVKTTWDTKGMLLLQVFLQCVAQEATFQNIINVENIFKIRNHLHFGETVMTHVH